jgi:hypothetical protein
MTSLWITMSAFQGIKDVPEAGNIKEGLTFYKI